MGGPFPAPNSQPGARRHLPGSLPGMSPNPGGSELPALGLQGANPTRRRLRGGLPAPPSSFPPLAGCGREGLHQPCALGGEGCS